MFFLKQVDMHDLRALPGLDWQVGRADSAKCVAPIHQELSQPKRLL